MGSGAAGWLNTTRYPPPTRTSASKESRVRPSDAGTHQRRNSSGVVHAWKTMRAGASNVRVATSSRSDVRSTVVRFVMGSLSFRAFIGLLLLFQLFDDPVQLAEARVPELAVALEPGRLFL